MNKKRIDALIPKAVEVLGKVEIAKENTITGNYQAQIASFGAAVSTGSLLAAVSSFSAQGNRQVKTDRLMYAIYLLITEDGQQGSSGSANEAVAVADTDVASATQERGSGREEEARKQKEEATKLYKHVKERQDDPATKEEVLDAAIALKLAMNLFEMIK